MARPAKAVSLRSGHVTEEERRIRQEEESRLRGKDDRIKPPEDLNENQRQIFEYVVEELAESGVLGNLDVFVLSAFAKAVDRIGTIEGMVEENPALLSNSALMGTKAKYMQDFWRGCNELCLSPQARAKIGSLSLQAQAAEKNPILEILNE